MTNEMILRFLKQRRFDELWEAGVLGAWEVNYAFQHGWMTESELLCWADQILNI